MSTGISRILESKDNTKRVGRDLVDALNKLKECVRVQLVDNQEEEVEGRELAIGRRILEICGGTMSHKEVAEIRELAQELVNIHSPTGPEPVLQ